MTILEGDCLDWLSFLPDESVHTCITSPPYFGLRDYGNDAQIGLEDTPQAYVQRLVEVFREVRRVLRADGTLWLNLGDSYAANRSYQVSQSKHSNSNASRVPEGMKAKDLIGIPWRAAFALRDDGWFLRQEIIWHKPNAMPESVRDRCTKAHETIFLLSKSGKYFFDGEAIKEPATDRGRENGREGRSEDERARPPGSNPRTLARKDFREVGRNKRSVWSVSTRAFKEAHFATYPPALIEPCVLAGAPMGGVVLDPFGGAGTTGLVAQQHGRQAVLIELNPEYAGIARSRLGMAA